MITRSHELGLDVSITNIYVTPARITKNVQKCSLCIISQPLNHLPGVKSPKVN